MVLVTMMILDDPGPWYERFCGWCVFYGYCRENGVDYGHEACWEFVEDE